jgi:glyoxylate/hydroxypyruvate reductase A
MFSARLNLAQGRDLQARHEWQKYHLDWLQPETRLGIAGIGEIGSEIARIGKSFGLEIWGLSRAGKAQDNIDKVFSVDLIAEFAGGVDILIITLPNTANTRDLFNRAVLFNMRPHALLINVGRGNVIDETAMIDLLKENRIALAVLDVFKTEPLPSDHPFWSLPNCIVTPHIGGPSLPRDITASFVRNLQRYLNGEPLLGLVDRAQGY